jgi:hypothetical protein
VVCGRTKPAIINHNPKKRKTKGSAVKILITWRKESKIATPKIIRKTPAFNGAHGRRFITDSTAW